MRRTTSNDEALFRGGHLMEWLEERLRRARQEVESYAPDQLLGAQVNDLVDYFVSKHAVEDVVLKDGVDDIEADEPVEATIEVNDYGRSYQARGTLSRFYVPFVGDAALFHLQGSTIIGMYPRASVTDSHLVFTFKEQVDNPDAIKTKLSQQTRLVREWLSGVTPGVAEFNTKLRNVLRCQIEERREKLLAGRQAVAATGFKIRARPGTATYAPPVVRRQVMPPRPPVAKPSAPEPSLDGATYDEILKVIADALVTAERSPSVFEHMQEEDIRQIILLFLNSVFSGEAMGEAFNAAGKTDILIRHDGKNIFIAEAKFWSGPKSLADAIDQVLSYTTWRDTKTAIVLLNRGVEFSTVLGKIPGVLREHASFVRSIESQPEGRFRAVLGRPGDAERKILLTVLAFDLPRAQAANS